MAGATADRTSESVEVVFAGLPISSVPHRDRVGSPDVVTSIRFRYFTQRERWQRVVTDRTVAR